MEDGFQIFEALGLFLGKLSHRDLGPAGDYIRHLVLIHRKFSRLLFLLPFFHGLFNLFPELLLLFLDLAGLLVGLLLDGLLLVSLQLIDLGLVLLDLFRLGVI